MRRDWSICQRKVNGTLTPLVNATSLQLECGKVLHEALLRAVLLYGSETGLEEEF